MEDFDAIIKYAEKLRDDPNPKIAQLSQDLLSQLQPQQAPVNGPHDNNAAIDTNEAESSVDGDIGAADIKDKLEENPDFEGKMMQPAFLDLDAKNQREKLKEQVKVSSYLDLLIAKCLKKQQPEK